MNLPPATAQPGASAWSFLAPAEQPDEIGRLAHYRVLRQLGAGGMGMVFLAEDMQLRRPAALKVMRPDYAADEEGRARFLREAQAAAALKHDHVVTIYQVGEDRGVPFLAMELLSGRSLDEWLRPDRRATVAETLHIGKQIAKGLAAAHGAGMIHRDIKPANLWLEAPHGRVKILDFGLARRVTGEFTALTQDGALLGTPAFMAPEQARGEPLDARCDLFSFGCVLFRMVTGRLPFQGNTLYAVLAAIASETPPPIGSINPQVPQRLIALIDRLLAKQPGERPGSAQQAVEELAAIERESKDQQIVPPPVVTAAADAASAPRPARVALSGSWRWLAGTAAIAAVVAVALAMREGGQKPIDALESTPAATLPIPVAPIPVAPIPAGPASVDLSALIDLNRDLLRGTWHQPAATRIRGYADAQNDWFAVVLPWQPPAEYRLKFRVARIKNGAGQFVVGLAQGDTRFNMMFDFPHGDQLFTGLGKVDGVGLVDRTEDPHQGRVLPDGLPMNVAITVRLGSVAVELNGHPLYAWSGDLSTAVRPSFQPGDALQVGGWYPGDFAVEDIVLESLGDDAGRPLHPQP